MKFFAVIAAFTFAAAVSAKTCGINGALCSRSVRSVGLTNKARAWISQREVPAIEVAEAEIEARAADNVYDEYEE